MVYIGIDPGAKGGIGIINEETFTEFVLPYSNEALIDICQLYQDRASVAVENVHAMPGQGVTSMFTFGRNFGYILGVLEAFQMRYTLVDPRAWKHYFGISADKQSSIDKCKELYPGINLLPTKRSRKESDGMAESILLARWGKEHESQDTEL